MVHTASVFCLHLIGQSSFYVIGILCNHMFTFLMFITEELHSVLLPQYLFETTGK